ncbi:MAG: hypothetical protein IKS96_02700 [Fibrobacter sp.]|nr:hypothetical protein [Bacteroidaceae bacterium]MBR6448852.1 hypothetical protein [Fibrobacter sp.]
MLKLDLYRAADIELISNEPLSVIQLSLLANEIRDNMVSYRPEFANLIKLHRNAGCRVNELFEPERWNSKSTSMLQVQPQKHNAMRLLQYVDIGYTDSRDFEATHMDMSRLPKRQYERMFSIIVRDMNLWRLYKDGFARPSTHFFRHVKIKELYNQGQQKEFIASWIGEKKVENLDYYLNSTYFV